MSLVVGVRAWRSHIELSALGDLERTQATPNLPEQLFIRKSLINVECGASPMVCVGCAGSGWLRATAADQPDRNVRSDPNVHHAAPDQCDDTVYSN